MSSENEPLSAADAADRIAHRWHERKKVGSLPPASTKDENEDVDDDEEHSPYTCENCGNHRFNVEREFAQTITYTRNLACNCEDTDTELAAWNTVSVTKLYREIGRLGNDHRWSNENGEGSEELDTLNEEEVDSGVDCERCSKKSRADEWETEPVTEGDIEDGDSEYFVRCEQCDHEIEFGYSHPEGGRIWPCESSDFNPWMCFPDARYREPWKRRGWLRPE